MTIRCWVLLLLLASCRAANVLVQHTPGGSSHLMALLRISEELASRGHHITLCLEDWEVATFASKGVLANENYTLLVNRAYATPEEGQREFIAIRDKMASLGHNPIAALTFVLGVQADLCKQFVLNPRTAKALAEVEVDLVIADFSNPCAVIIADMKLVPYVIFSPTSLGEPLTTAMAGVHLPPATFPMHGTGMQPRMTFLQRMVNFAAYHFMARVLAPGMLHNDLRRELNVTTRTSIGDARLFLLNADFAVEFPVSLPPFYKFVGPLLAAPSKPLPADLEALLTSSSAGSVFVSFGSAFVLDKKEEVLTLAASLSSLAAKNITVLWRITEAELPPGTTLESLALPSGVHPLSWVPQNDLLGSPYLSAFISHGGTNGVYEAPFHGVPLISIPFANDHMDHAAKAEHRGYGITVPRSTLTGGNPTPLIAAVEELIADPRYRESARKVGEMLRGYARRPAERAADWVEYSMAMPADGSGDLRGVAGELSWAALHSIDAWATWVGVAVAAVGVVLGVLWGGWKAVAAVVGGVRRTAFAGKAKKE